MKPNYNQLLMDIKPIIEGALPGKPTLDAAMRFLHESRRDYHWVGIYYLSGQMLYLGPYYGPETDHAEIPVGRGVCGTAVAQDRNQVITDVRQLENYLACNLETRSEIVVLIKDKAGATLGQIDVDGTEIGAFDEGEEPFLVAVAELLAPHMTLAQAKPSN